MGEDQGAVSARAIDDPNAPRGEQPPDDPAQLRDDIERTREDLGDTVAALAEKTDVKTRAKEKVAEVRHNVSERRAELAGRGRDSTPSSAGNAALQVRVKAQENPVPTAALAAFVGGLIFGRLTKRR
jgi:ElaB/YqjD/DUF883 family membrane-anchored ribosome-binding protein